MKNRYGAILLKAFGIAWLLILGLFFYHFWTHGSPTTWADGTQKASDLCQHYVAGKMWIDGKRSELYTDSILGDEILSFELGKRFEGSSGFNYVYSPLTALSAIPFTFLSYPAFIDTWMLLTCVFYFAGLIFLKKLFPFPSRGKTTLWIYLIGIPSFYYALILGQNTPLTFAIFATSAWVLSKNRPWIAGWVFSCAFYKPQYMPYLALFMLLCGQWRFALGVGFGNLFWLLLGGALCGLDTYTLWFQSLFNMMSGAQMQVDNINVSWRGFFLTVLPEKPATLLATTINAVCLILFSSLAGALYLLRSRLNLTPVHHLYIGLAAWLIFSPYVMHYELLLGLFWWLCFVTQKQKSPLELILTASYWILALLAIDFLTIGISILAPLLTVWLVLSILSWSSRQSTPSQAAMNTASS